MAVICSASNKSTDCKNLMTELKSEKRLVGQFLLESHHSCVCSRNLKFFVVFRTQLFEKSQIQQMSIDFVHSCNYGGQRSV